MGGYVDRLGEEEIDYACEVIESNFFNLAHNLQSLSHLFHHVTHKYGVFSQPQDSICPQSCSGTLTLWPAHTHVAALSQAECPGHSVLGSQLSPCFVNSAGAGKAGMLC